MTVFSGLLTAKHKQRMGSAIWEYLWLVSKQTGKDGAVLGGKTVQASVMAEELGVSEHTVRANLRMLVIGEYIEAVRTQLGYKVTITKAKKFRTADEQNGSSSDRQTNSKRTVRPPENVQSPKHLIDIQKDIQGGERSSAPSTRKPKGKDDPAFDEFWAEYPRKVSKHNARIRWDALMRDGVDPAMVIKGARNFAAHCKAESKEAAFIKWPEGWLNGRMYDDWQEAAEEESDGGYTDYRTYEHKDNYRHWPEWRDGIIGGVCEVCERKAREEADAA
jgi:hypothetical protein